MTDRDSFAAAALTGLLAQGDDGSFSEESYVRSAYRWADAMLRCRGGGDYPLPDNAPNLDAAPVATARTDADRGRTDKADSRPGKGTGDTQEPHATHSVGSVRREGTEPVAWAVCCPGDGNWSPCFFHEQHAQRHASAILGSKNIVPLYRHPPCQDVSQKNLTLTDAEREAIERGYCSLMGVEDMSAECSRWDAEAAATLRGLLERLGGGK